MDDLHSRHKQIKTSETPSFLAADDLSFMHNEGLLLVAPTECWSTAVTELYVFLFKGSIELRAYAVCVTIGELANFHYDLY